MRRALTTIEPSSSSVAVIASRVDSSSVCRTGRDESGSTRLLRTSLSVHDVASAQTTAKSGWGTQKLRHAAHDIESVRRCKSRRLVVPMGVAALMSRPSTTLLLATARAPLAARSLLAVASGAANRPQYPRIADISRWHGLDPRVSATAKPPLGARSRLAVAGRATNRAQAPAMPPESPPFRAGTASTRCCWRQRGHPLAQGLASLSPPSIPSSTARGPTSRSYFTRAHESSLSPDASSVPPNQ